MVLQINEYQVAYPIQVLDQDLVFKIPTAENLQQTHGHR